METLYLIPGTGADYRFFSKLQLDVETKVINWSEWGSANSISEYAKILSEQIDITKPFGVLGVSFGGMIALEMSKFLEVEKLIIVSSAKTYKELPAILRFAKYSGLGYLIYPWMIRKVPFAAKMFGVNKKEKLFFDRMLAGISNNHLRKTILSILKWKNVDYPTNMLHVHGDKDIVIPIKNNKDLLIVKGGGHFMIYNKAKQISELINNYLAKK